MAAPAAQNKHGVMSRLLARALHLQGARLVRNAPIQKVNAKLSKKEVLIWKVFLNIKRKSKK
jgi:hypothetical protein